MIAPLRAVGRTESLPKLVELVDFVYHVVMSAVVASMTVSMKKLFPLICAVQIVLNVLSVRMDWMMASSKMECLMSWCLTPLCMVRGDTLKP